MISEAWALSEVWLQQLVFFALSVSFFVGRIFCLYAAGRIFAACGRRIWAERQKRKQARDEKQHHHGWDNFVQGNGHAVGIARLRVLTQERQKKD